MLLGKPTENKLKENLWQSSTSTAWSLQMLILHASSILLQLSMTGIWRDILFVLQRMVMNLYAAQLNFLQSQIRYPIK